MTTVVGRRYSYEVIQDWAKWPPGMALGTGVPRRDPITGLNAADVGNVCAVAVDSQDRVYVGRRPDPPVVVFDREGNFLSSWGNGAIGYPHGLYVANDIVYVADRDYSVCLMYTLDGKPLQILGTHGAHSDTGAGHNQPVPRPAGPFNFPGKLVSSPWGDLYAADGHRNARVHRFDSGGHLIQSWGTWGRTAPGEFWRPHAVVAARDGRLYVCDRDNNRIQVFSKNGEFIAMWPEVVVCPGDIAETPDGGFAVSERGLDRTFYRISILDREGTVLARLDARESHALCVDSQGAIYNATMYFNNVDKYVPQDRHQS